MGSIGLAQRPTADSECHRHQAQLSSPAHKWALHHASQLQQGKVKQLPNVTKCQSMYVLSLCQPNTHGKGSSKHSCNCSTRTHMQKLQRKSRNAPPRPTTHPSRVELSCGQCDDSLAAAVPQQRYCIGCTRLHHDVPQGPALAQPPVVVQLIQQDGTPGGAEGGGAGAREEGGSSRTVLAAGWHT